MAETATASKPSMAPRTASSVTTRMRDQPKRLPESHFQFKNKAQGLFTVFLPKIDMSFEDVLRPDFWAQVASKLAYNPVVGGGEDYSGSEITVFGPERAWKADLTIIAIRADAMDVVCTGPQIDPETGRCCPVDLREGRKGLPCLGRAPEEPAEATDTVSAQYSGDYDIRWNPGKKRHQVISKTDRAILADFATKAEAEDWIRNKAA